MSLTGTVRSGGSSPDVVSAEVVEDVVSVLVVVPCLYRVKKVHTFRYVIYK